MVQIEDGGGGVTIGKEVVVYVCFEWYTEEGVNRVVLYVGRRIECVWMWDNMGEVAALKLVEKVLSLEERKLWLSMKFNRRILVRFIRDGDSLKLVKVMMEYAYMYVNGKGGPSHAPLKVHSEAISLSAIMLGDIIHADVILKRIIKGLPSEFTEMVANQVEAEPLVSTEIGSTLS
ncbi:hypothetical protein Cgig2_013815 [Carnegiea gigantea]|uniref:Uncharacterized protein n=1 Tax=Carnegiea gigantea TaxID=171969 RepID=A0A9Q1JLA5_9CARY|nr:hypothetical protein Cgig2_013815 [Carnegiea gigantea]